MVLAHIHPECGFYACSWGRVQIGRKHTTHEMWIFRRSGCFEQCVPITGFYVYVMGALAVV